MSRGELIDTSSLGGHAFGVVASDADGQTGSEILVYVVVPPPGRNAIVGADAAAAAQSLTRAGIGRLADGLTVNGDAPAAGTIQLRLTAALPGTAAAAAATKGRRPVLIASARKAVTHRGAYRLKFKARHAVRAKLRHLKRLSATVTITFSDHKGHTVKRSRYLTIRR